MATAPPLEQSEKLEDYGGERLGPGSLRLHGWKITATSGAMAGAEALASLEKELASSLQTEDLPPLPEIVFSQNVLTLTHEKSGTVLRFDALGALTCWARLSAEKGADGVQVPMASRPAWRDKSEKMGCSSERDFDWTYTTDYAGSTSISSQSEPVEADAPADSAASNAEQGAPSGASAAWLPHEGPGIDMTLLRRTDVPILCFADLVIYSDDLHDCGDSELRLRLRVMPKCIFILMRHFLRVDGVLIRQRDTRVFHKFGSSTVLRAQRLAQAPLPPLPSAPVAAPPAAPGAPPAAPLGALLPSEAEAAQRLAAMPPKLDIIEELKLSL